MRQQWITLLPVLLLLQACGNTPQKEVIIKTKPVQIDIIQPERPKAVQLERPQWFVVTKTNLDKFLQEVEKMQSEDPVFFAFTPQDYEKMSFNLQELRRYILQQNEIIIYYEKMTAPKKEDGVTNGSKKSSTMEAGS